MIRKLCYYIVKLLVFPFAVLPYSWQWGFARLVALFLYYVIKMDRRVMRYNLSIAFPTASKAEHTKIGIACLQNISMYFFDFCNVFYISQQKKEEFICELSSKTNLIGSSHIASGPIIGAIANSLTFPNRLSIITKQSFLLNIVAGLFGAKILSTKDKNSTLSILKALKRGEAVLFTTDTYGIEDRYSTTTKFFGKDSKTYMMLAKLSQLSNIPACIGIHIRDGSKMGRVKLFEPVEVVLGEDGIQQMTERYVKLLESIATEYREEWWWFYRRYRDWDSIKFYKGISDDIHNN